MEEGTLKAPIYTCETRSPDAGPHDFGQFLPVFASQLTPDAPSGTYGGRCFDEIDLELKVVNQTQF